MGTWSQWNAQNIEDEAAQVAALKLGRQIYKSLLASDDPRWVANREKLTTQLGQVEAELRKTETDDSCPW